MDDPEMDELGHEFRPCGVDPRLDAMCHIPSLVVEPPLTGDDIEFTHEEEYRLALESIERWAGRYRLSPAQRLRAIRAVCGAVLSDESAVG